MITNISLQFGKAVGSAAITFECTPITIFVGPNNSGKSKVLHELFEFCSSSPFRKTSDVILDNVQFEAFSKEEAES